MPRYVEQMAFLTTPFLTLIFLQDSSNFKEELAELQARDEDRLKEISQLRAERTELVKDISSLKLQVRILLLFTKPCYT